MRFKFATVLALVALLSLTLLPTPASAVDVYARVHGTVTDATGAVVTGVEVIATNVSNGIATTVTSQADGTYTFLQLAPGTYNIKATKQGFSTFATSNFILELNQILVQNISLKIGQVSETVTVEAAANQVETTSMQLGSVITGSTIRDMPLIGRDWIQLQQLQPGVVASSDRFGNAYATNGSQTQQNSYLVNGVDTNDIALNTAVVTPSPDAISEFNMVTNTINPEYGRNSGAILNATIKSGTNQFHGSGFEFYRDTFLNSRRWFTSGAPIFHQNMFGGTIGGPIWKDHTFFFFSYQGTRYRQPQATSAVTVPITAWRNRNFGAGALSGTSPFAMVGEDGLVHPAGTDYSLLFPTGNIPAADVSAVANNLMPFVPAPNSGTDQFVFNGVQPGKTNQYIIRGDHTFNDHNNISFYTLWANTGFNRTLPFTGATLPGFGDQSTSTTKQYVFTYNHAFSGTTLNEFRVGLTRFNYKAVYPYPGPVDPASLGFAINPQNPISGVPLITVNNPTSSGGHAAFTLGFSTNGPQPRIDSTYQLTDNFSKVVGKHTLKMGFEGRHFVVWNPFSGNNNGSYGFATDGVYSTSNAFADFLLGLPDTYSQGSGGRIDATAQQYYAYFQDQWKVKNNLTVTWGAGYQLDTPLKDHWNNNNAINCFVPGGVSTIYPTAPTNLLFQGDPGCPAGGFRTRFGHVGPRVGFAYSPDWGWLTGGPGKTSIRGGYGIYFNRGEEELMLQFLGAVPFGLTSYGIGGTGAGSPSLANPWCDVAGGGCMTNPYPFTPPAPGTPVDFSQFAPTSQNYLDPDFTTAYAMNYNLTIEREMPFGMIVSLGYVGSQGRHLFNTSEMNPSLDPTGCAADPVCRANRNYQSVYFPEHYRFAQMYNVGGEDVNFWGGVAFQRSNGISHYNSFQTSVKKSLSHGLDFMAAYTWSHSTDTTSGYEDSYNTRSPNYNLPMSYNFSDSNFDARHRFVFNWTYEIWTPQSVKDSPALKRILGGWRFAGITTFQMGFPVNVYDTANRSLTCSGGMTYYGCPDGPNISGPVDFYSDPRTSPSHKWFNTSNFSHPAWGTFGNVRRYPFHGPGINNFDLALYKEIPVTEGKYFQLRLESYNAFNHAQFNNPTGNANSANFGRITSARLPRQYQIAAKFIF